MKQKVLHDIATNQDKFLPERKFGDDDDDNEDTSESSSKLVVKSRYAKKKSDEYDPNDVSSEESYTNLRVRLQTAKKKSKMEISDDSSSSSSDSDDDSSKKISRTWLKKVLKKEVQKQLKSQYRKIAKLLQKTGSDSTDQKAVLAHHKFKHDEYKDMEIEVSMLQDTNIIKAWNRLQRIVPLRNHSKFHTAFTSGYFKFLIFYQRNGHPNVPKNKAHWTLWHWVNNQRVYMRQYLKGKVNHFSDNPKYYKLLVSSNIEAWKDRSLEGT